MESCLNKHTFFVFSLFVITSFFTSCSSISFISEGKTPYKISVGQKSDQLIEVIGSVDFYFWGMSPGVFKIDHEDVESMMGFNNPSFVSVEQSISLKNFFYTIVTLGLYCPLDYKIKVLSDKEPLK